ncbi:ABC-2 type transport system permease protein [Ruminococcaceae bacterium FB2012]|nr:ABC-2 type transport system permease protein [Ruminococcaceae bacterium FB2012]
MFLHDLKYELISSLRTKQVIIWLLIYPMILGTLFKVAFSGIYEKENLFSSVPAVVVGCSEGSPLRSVLDGMKNSDKPLLDVKYADREEAEKLLNDGDTEGIIDASGEALTLTVAGEGMNETILKAFCDQYNSNAKVITESASDPAKLGAVTEQLMKDANVVEHKQLVEGNMDFFVEYFYNLVAMIALFGSMIGITAAMDNQANLSALGARKCCSPRPKMLSLLAALTARFILMAVCMVITISYFSFILKIDYGERLGLVYLAGTVGGMLGVSLGFAVGSIGFGNYGIKNSILTAVSLLLCFCSGLMDGNMKIRIQENVPVLNKLNPAAVIADSMHCLNVFNDTKMYTEKLITMLVMTAVLVMFGFIITRRRKYASL